MGKERIELTTDVVQEIIRAKAQIIASTTNIDIKQTMIEEHLSNEAVASTIKKVFAAVNNPMD